MKHVKKFYTFSYLRLSISLFLAGLVYIWFWYVPAHVTEWSYENMMLISEDIKESSSFESLVQVNMLYLERFGFFFLFSSIIPFFDLDKFGKNQNIFAKWFVLLQIIILIFPLASVTADIVTLHGKDFLGVLRVLVKSIIASAYIITTFIFLYTGIHFILSIRAGK